MLTYDPVAGLRHYPLSLERFGKNPYGGALYRIVFAPSRRYLVCGEWPDGSNKASYARKYPQLCAHRENGTEVGIDHWIMERWLPAEEYAKCSKEYWDRELLILGPWPAQGEYELCHVFEACGPSDAALDVLVAAIEEGRRRSFWEKRVFHQEEADREKKAISDQQEAMIRNWLPAFGSAPMIGRGGGRGTKTVPIVRTAEELGLPTQGGAFRTKHRPDRPQFEVPISL